LRYSTCNYIVTLKPGLGSLKVIRTDTDRSATCDVLLTFHSNHGLSRTDFRRNSQNFLTPVYFSPLLPAEWGFPMEFGTSARGQKTRMMELPGRERSLTISSAVWIQHTNLSDGRTPGDSKDRAYA